MDLTDLVKALIHHDMLSARQWVADAMRNNVKWVDIEAPTGMSEIEMAIAAGVVELLAERAGKAAPSWTLHVPASSVPMFLVQSAQTMPRLRQICEQSGPEALRKRHIYAPPDFLTAA